MIHKIKRLVYMYHEKNMTPYSAIQYICLEQLSYSQITKRHFTGVGLCYTMMLQEDKKRQLNE